MKRRHLLKGALGVPLLTYGCGTSGHAAAEVFEFWNALFDSDTYINNFLPWWEEKIQALLPAGTRVSYGVLGYSSLEQRYLIAAQTGKPDLVEGVLSQVPIYQAPGLIEPLSERFLAWEEHDQFLQSALDPITFNGALWGLPYIGNARALVYRKSVLKKHGLNVPATWDELLEAARTISANEPGMVGYMVTSRRGLVRGFQEFMSHVYQLSDHLFLREEGAWRVELDVEGLSRVLDFYRALFAGDPSPVPRVDRGKEALAMDRDYTVGKIAMVPNGPFLFGRRLQSDLQRQILEQDTGVAPLPVPTGGQAGTFLEVKTVMINSHSRAKELAWEVAKLWCGQQGITHHTVLGGDAPVRKDVLNNLNTLLDPAALAWQASWAPIFPTGRALAPVPFDGAREAIFDAVQEAIFSNGPIVDVAKTLHKGLVAQAQTFA